ncbi:MAG: glucose-1-phosphate thymidylyltransferase, partial [Clostridia bacterium]|nr:glucose-1-phosphate thymidylyltransferase [Clostridia bacterium]
DGAQFGISLSYKVQPSPDGIAQAFLLGEAFLGGDRCVLILGDNIYHSDRFFCRVREALAEESGRDSAVIFCRRVSAPQDFGIAELDAFGRVLSVEEKPAAPKSSNAVTGLYIFPSDVCENAKRIRPSSRGELEITSLLELYRAEGRLTAGILEDDCFWIDAGSFDRLAEAAEYVRKTERRTDRLIGSPEAAAHRNGWITKQEKEELIDRCRKTPYGELLAKTTAT